jgi:hypothetical protein
LEGVGFLGQEGVDFFLELRAVIVEVVLVFGVKEALVQQDAFELFVGE